MNAGEDIKTAIREACREAAHSVSGSIRRLSWFYRNSVASDQAPKEKMAA